MVLLEKAPLSNEAIFILSSFISGLNMKWSEKEKFKRRLFG